MQRLMRVIVAWLVGWVIYMIVVVLWGYDGPVGIGVQAAYGAVVSGGAVGLALLVGLVLLVPALGRAWDARPVGAVALAVAALAVMFLGSTLGLTGTYTDPETTVDFRALHPVAALLSYFALLFAVANWPRGGWGSRRLPADSSPPGATPLAAGAEPELGGAR